MTILLGLGQFFFLTKIGRFILICGVVIAAFSAFTGYVAHHAAASARAKLIAEAQAATEREHQRREQALADAQKQAQESINQLAVTEAHNADLRTKIVRLSAANDRVGCLDPLGVRRLREIGFEAGGGTGKPAGKPAAGARR
jgi:hypothetical protein